MASYRTDKSFLILMRNTNYCLIDSYIFLPHGLFQHQYLDLQVESLKYKINPDLNVLICLQMKKDLEVVKEEYNKILTNWKSKIDKDLKKYYPNCNFLLFLVTQSLVMETGRSVESFNHADDGVFIMLVDKTNSTYFYGKN